MTRVLWLLLVDTGRPAVLESTVAETATAIASEPTVRVRFGARTGAADLDRLEHYRAVPGRVDAVLEIRPHGPEVDLDALAARASTLLGPALAAAIHPLIGTEHEMTPGESDWVLLYPIRRLPSMSHQEFSEVWLSHGAAVREGGLSVKSSGAANGYRQFHVELASPDSFDGVAIAHWQDRQTLVERLTERRASVEDETNFIDHGRSAVGAIELISREA